MITERTHIAESPRGIPQRCSICGAVLSYGKPFPANARVGVIIATAAGAVSAYEVINPTAVTPAACQ